MFEPGSLKHPAKVIKIGVSACLLGSKVRFDGGHKRSRFITDSLAEYFEFTAYCPEVAIGMGTPRQPIRLTGDAQSPEAVGVKTPELNVTQPLRTYGEKIAGGIDGLCGFIFKKDSPSCGMARVKVYNAKGMPERVGTGLFAREVMKANPLLPVEEEGRLNDADLRDNFITRVYVYARWKALIDKGLSKAGLISFHSGHKYLVMSHSNEMYRELGQMLSDLTQAPLTDIADRYIVKLMQALRLPATRKRHTNVLQHLLGYLKNNLDSAHRTDLSKTIDSYRRGEFPLVVPIRLLQHHFSMHPHPYINKQVYLAPHPQALLLRNNL
jgi:uncharacterized protein YbgA (DUF1722 family)/uncharacterized protein YbbK (DUF523 family)